MNQLPLPLSYAHRTSEADFFIHHATVLLGPEGSGKSHLAAIFRARHGVRVDVVDARIAASDEVALFHRFNGSKNAGRGLLIVAREMPVVALPDLASRLGAASAVRIEAPDDAVLGAVMIKAARDRGLSVPPEVVSFALPRLERRFAAIHDFVARLDAASLAQRRDVTVPLASVVLSKL
jgi:chromosomal replication initiation ATPase DnaA